MKFESSIGKLDLTVVWRVYVKADDDMCCIPLVKNSFREAGISAVARVMKTNPDKSVHLQGMRPTSIAWAYKDGKLIPTKDVSMIWREFFQWWASKGLLDRMESRINNL